MTSPSAAPVGPTTKVRISPSVYARAFGAELVLLDFARGEYFGLDEIAADIWRGLEAQRDLGGIATTLVAGYDVVEEEALRDVIGLVCDLAGQGLIVIDAC